MHGTIMSLEGGPPVGGARRRGMLAAGVAGIIVLFAGILLTELIANLMNDAARERLQATALSRLAEARAKLEGEINATLYIGQGLVSYAATRPGLSQEEFQRFAEQTVSIGRNVRSVAIAPDNVIAYVYPLASNERALGFDYRESADQWPAVKRVMDERATIIAGPVDLVQGGRALIARTPIYRPGLDSDPQAEPGYWGVASVVINMEGLFADAGILPKTGGYEFAMRGADGKGADGDPIMGDPALFENDAVTLPVSLPHGSWELAARPAGGWYVDKTGIHAARGIGYGISLLIAVLSGLVVSAHQRARAMALHDPLTGLPNRRLLEDRLSQLAALCERTDLGFLVLYLDLNGFKPINDAYGHAVGDALLQEIGRRITDATRRSDTVARIGGDEFVIIVPGAGGEQTARHLAGRLRQRVSEPLIIGERSITIEVSIGWAAFPTDSSSVDDLLALADRRMYSAKKSASASS
ncbi:diguanylate cyclase [Stappia sp. GBMRC 2046]|uniref:Diguanylate cyclase n=1 Tax=Stappia sediminis TaxID=2692190 RepID=A0A7X3LXG4_9HYPH|nr:diguanylate cyclase [Stappia sediminis]MXN66831.1 diguanylate cyclase [Stappia sediminis]